MISPSLECTASGKPRFRLLISSSSSPLQTASLQLDLWDLLSLLLPPLFCVAYTFGTILRMPASFERLASARRLGLGCNSFGYSQDDQTVVPNLQQPWQAGWYAQGDACLFQWGW
nr:hypothetical protein Iba_chr14eCG7310 [Ipomoea batatas]